MQMQVEVVYDLDKKHGDALEESKADIIEQLNLTPGKVLNQDADLYI